MYFNNECHTDNNRVWNTCMKEVMPLSVMVSGTNITVWVAQIIFTVVNYSAKQK